MRNIIVKPLGRIDTADGPLYATEVDGVMVHGGKPMTPEGRDAIAAVIGAAKRYLSKMRPPSPCATAQPDGTACETDGES